MQNLNVSVWWFHKCGEYILQRLYKMDTTWECQWRPAQLYWSYSGLAFGQQLRNVRYSSIIWVFSIDIYVIVFKAEWKNINIDIKAKISENWANGIKILYICMNMKQYPCSKCQTENCFARRFYLLCNSTLVNNYRYRKTENKILIKRFQVWYCMIQFK